MEQVEIEGIIFKVHDGQLVLQNRFIKNISEIKGLEKLDELEIIELKIEQRRVLDDWNIKCLYCNAKFSTRITETGENSETYGICLNLECSNYNTRTIAYTKAPPGMRCWRDNHLIEKYLITINESEKRLELMPYCDNCKKITGKHIKSLKFNPES